MSVGEEWRNAPKLTSDDEQFMQQLCLIPAATEEIALPTPPGINGWWEPFTLRIRGRPVASLRLTRQAVAYKKHAERLLLESHIDPVELEDKFADLWLDFNITTFLKSPLERDADGVIKPLQDFFCSLLGVDDARVRRSVGQVRLDPYEPRVFITISGFRSWNSSGDDGPYYLVRTRKTAEGLRTEPQLVTSKRLRALRTSAVAQ